ncbi:spore coat associated protein YheD [Bacillaceae bacterium]
MTIPNSGWLTIDRLHQTWTLHLPRNKRLLHKRSKNHFVCILGPKNMTKKIRLSFAPPPAHAAKVLLKLENKHLKIGPLVGIMTAKRNSRTFRGNRKNFIDIITTAKQLGGLVFVFTPEGIDWAAHTIDGYLYDERLNRWTSAKLPFPDVIYNRVPYREDEKETSVQKAIEILANMKNVHLFNKHFFNKWNLFQTLKKKKKLSHLLPDTRLLSSLRDLQEFLAFYDMVYLKPVNDKAGKGIMKIERHKSKFRLYRRTNKGMQKTVHATPEKVWERLQGAIKGRNYLIQQGIRLATYQNKPFDIRLLVQRNRQGAWQVTGIGIRVAGVRSITTHVPQGGSIASPKEVFRAVFPQERHEEILSRIETAALTIAEFLAENYPHLGEMSMDLGIDPRGDLWFFEANAKPMKFDEPDIRKLSLERLIEYAQYLAGFHAPGEEIAYANQNDRT